jgi:hypothetical protein
MHVSGPKLVEPERQVLWRQSIVVDGDIDESIIEISKTKNKFIIVAYNQGTLRYQVIDMFRAQGRKLLASCEESFTKLMTLLEYKFGKLLIKDQASLIQ